MTPDEVQAALDEGQDLVILDVRQPEELTLASVPGVLHIPMGEVPGRAGELPRDRPIVVMCHHGVRSAQVVAYLRQVHGFERVENLSGGIDAWADLDPRISRY